MLERDFINRENHEEVQKRERMQRLSREAWQTSPSFTRYASEKQQRAIEALTTVGLAADAKCHKNWNSKRWADVLEAINEETPEIVSQILSVTSETAGTNAFRNLFQMLEVGANTMQELRDKKRLNSKRQQGVTAKIFHTRQSPASKASVQDR